MDDKNLETLRKISKKGSMLEKTGMLGMAKEFIDIEESIGSLDSKLDTKFSDLSDTLKKKLELELSYEVDEKKIVDSVLSKVEIPAPITGQQGLKGDKGSVGEKGDSGSNGKDGKDGLNGLNGLPGANGSADTPEEIVIKLETLEGEDRLDATAIKNLPQFIERSPIPNGGGWRNLFQLHDVSINNATLANNDVVKYNSTTRQWENKTDATGSGTVTSVNASGGTTGLTFSGGPITTSGTLTLAGTLAVANGGTGSSTAPYVTDTTNTTLTRSGTGPYTLGLNLSNANTWLASQKFTGGFGVGTTGTELTINGAGSIVTAGTFNGVNMVAGVIDSAVWHGSTIGIAYGGTGQTTANAAFNALSPMTTGGDLIYGGASGVGTRLANGSNGQVLTSAGGTSAPTWTTLSIPTGANPTASIGLSAVNGSALTFMRSDGAPALSQAIVPTWTGVHTFSPTARTSGVASYFTINAPADTGITANTESIGINVVGATRTWADGTVSNQREFYIQAPTYNKTTTSATFARASSFSVSGAPIAGTGVTITNSYAIDIPGISHFGSQLGGTTQQQVGGTGLDVADSNNTTGGQTINVINTNSGTVAFSGISLGTNLSNGSTFTHYGGIFLNGGNFNDNSFGTAFNIANQLSFYGTDGPTLIGTLATGASAYVNFVVGGASTTNEVFRIASDVITETMTSTGGAGAFGNAFAINHTVNMSSTASSASVVINRVNTGVGSGFQDFLRLNTSGATKLWIRNDGTLIFDRVVGNTSQTQGIFASRDGGATVDNGSGVGYGLFLGQFGSTNRIASSSAAVTIGVAGAILSNSTAFTPANTLVRLQGILIASDSGAATFTALDYNGTIAQTVGTGANYGINIHPILVASSGGWSSYATNVNSPHYAFNGSGTGKYLFGGNITMAASTTSAATYNIPAGTAPTSPIEGDMWADSTQKAEIAFIDGIKQARNGTIFTQTADKTVTNTVTETSIVGTGTGGLTLPANFWTAGKTIRVQMSGVYSTVAVTGDSVTVKIKYGTTVLATKTTSSLLTGASNLYWESDVLITCRTTGATGTVQVSGSMRYQVAGSAVIIDELNNGAATTTLDTTASGLFDVTVTHGAANASNTVKSLTGSFNVFN